jgi:hypothetical protein
MAGIGHLAASLCLWLKLSELEMIIDGDEQRI